MLDQTWGSRMETRCTCHIFLLKPGNPSPPWRHGSCQDVLAPSTARTPAQGLLRRRREPRGRSGCSGTCRGQPSCCCRGSAPRPKCAGVACGAPDLWQFRHSRRGPLSALAAFGASLHYKQRGGAVSRGPPLVCLEVTLSLQARFPLPFLEHLAVAKSG